MDRIRQHLTYANVISSICLFLLLGGGTAVALGGSNTVFSDDLVNNQVYSADVRNDTLSGGGLAAADLRSNSVGASEVVNGALNDEDIGQATYHFSGNIGTVSAQTCVAKPVTGINAQADHLLLTPNVADSDSRLDYGVEYHPDPDAGLVLIRICNPTTAPIEDASTTFNLLVIDAE